MTNMSNEEEAKPEAEEAETVEVEAKDEQPAEADTEVVEADEESKQLEAELKREREAREKAEKALAEGRYKRAESKRKEEVSEEVEESDDDKPMTRRELQSEMAKREDAIRKEVLNSEAKRLADSMSTNDTEKALILEKWKSHTFPTHISLEEQIESCYAMAFRKRIIGQRDEAMRALKGKEGVNKDPSSTHHDTPTGSAPRIAGADAAELARVGYIYNSSAKRYEKKLGNGKLLVKKDLKTPAQMA